MGISLIIVKSGYKKNNMKKNLFLFVSIIVLLISCKSEEQKQYDGLDKWNYDIAFGTNFKCCSNF